MREIKFRAWHKVRELMAKVDNIILGRPNGIIVHMDCDDFACPMEDIELMQFTGLKDKNGKEIYEGDILKDKNNILWRVYFTMGKYSLFCDTHNLIKSINIKRKQEITEDDQLVKDLGVWWSNKEVIGNIYENKLAGEKLK